MTLVILALATGGIGAWLRRWWLLALPPAAAVGAGVVLVMPGSHVTSDNPLPFLLVVVEAALAIGIALGSRLRHSAVSS